MKKLYRFDWDCGRQGSVSGLFVSDEDTVLKAIGKDCYLGEILGKHSEIGGTLDEADIIILTDDQDFIKQFEEIVKGIGYNPLEYIREEN